jgi:hypothetical protein
VSTHNEATTSALPGSDDDAAVIHASVGAENAEIRGRIKVTILHVGDAAFAVRGPSERATNLALPQTRVRVVSESMAARRRYRFRVDPAARRRRFDGDVSLAAVGLRTRLDVVRGGERGNLAGERLAGGRQPPIASSSRR